MAADEIWYFRKMGFIKREAQWLGNELDTRALLRQSQVLSYDIGQKRLELDKLERKAKKKNDPKLLRDAQWLRDEIDRMDAKAKALSDEYDRVRAAEKLENEQRRKR
jgi:hypothetical protein